MLTSSTAPPAAPAQAKANRALRSGPAKPPPPPAAAAAAPAAVAVAPPTTVAPAAVAPARRERKRTVVAPVRPNPPASVRHILLEESDSDEYEVVRKRPRIDVLDLNPERILLNLGAHASKGAKWPASTDKLCWTCCHGFTTIPIGMPSRCNPTTRVFTKCVGIFCSFNCAKRYALNNTGHRAWECMQMLGWLHTRIIGFTTRITPAPPYTALACFGGVLSIDEFRKGSLTLPPTNEMYNDPQYVSDIVDVIDEMCLPVFMNTYQLRRGGVSLHTTTTTTRQDNENGDGENVEEDDVEGGIDNDGADVQQQQQARVRQHGGSKKEAAVPSASWPSLTSAPSSSSSSSTRARPGLKKGVPPRAVADAAVPLGAARREYDRTRPLMDADLLIKSMGGRRVS